MIKSLYAKYFQKSRSFLYPLTGLSRKSPFPPRQTYIAWKNIYKPEDNKLIVVFDIRLDSDQWQSFLEKRVYNSPLFHDTCMSCEEIINKNDEVIKRQLQVVVYDFSYYRQDMELFRQGKYSQLSMEFKQKIREYYGYDSPEWAYMETFVFPSKHFKRYAEILNVEESLLKEVGELCEKVDFNREIFTGECITDLQNFEGNFVDLNNDL
jgi:hypothetical protein